LKKYILLSFLISLLLSSCKEKTIIESELESLGIAKENYNKIDTAFYQNKKVKSLRFYKEKTEYIDVNFYESGKRKSLGNVKNNQCHNEYIDWYENGKQKWIRNYNLGSQIGKSKSFFEDGNLEKEYDNNTKESTDYWENGKAKFKFIEKISSSYHYFNGNILEKYKNKLNDEYDVEYFNENGKVVFSGLYKKKILFKDNLKYNGKIICYFINGKISLFQNVVNGIPNGKFYSSYGNGNLKYECEVDNGKEIYYKAFYENGNIHFIRDGIKNTFTEWDEKGKLIK
jgi:antitoxin component YwqK of YwqJK toxin-antitoxin module